MALSYLDSFHGYKSLIAMTDVNMVKVMGINESEDNYNYP